MIIYVGAKSARGRLEAFFLAAGHLGTRRRTHRSCFALLDAQLTRIAAAASITTSFDYNQLFVNRQPVLLAPETPSFAVCD